MRRYEAMYYSPSHLQSLNAVLPRVPRQLWCHICTNADGDKEHNICDVHSHEVAPQGKMYTAAAMPQQSRGDRALYSDHHFG